MDIRGRAPTIGHDVLYGRLPICKGDGVRMVKGSAAVLYPALSCRRKPAGPDGIRRERPYLVDALAAQDIIQVYVPAVRPVVPSSLHQPTQPHEQITLCDLCSDHREPGTHAAGFMLT